MPNSIGTQLQQAREARKLSRKDVSQATKIQPWVLEALETDRLLEQMSAIYVKGFLSTYAKFLQLAPEPLIAQLLLPLAPPKPQEPELPPPTRATPQLPTLVLPRVTLPKIPVPKLTIPKIAIPKLTPPEWKMPQWRLPKWEIPVEVQRRVAQLAVVSAVVAGLIVINPLQWLSKIKLPTLRAPTLASVTPVKAPEPPPAPKTVPLQPSTSLELQVNAHRTTWIQIKADGKLLTQQRLPRGANERWVAKKRFELIIAKPSQVELLLNGQSIGSFAIAHQGRLLITPTGVTPLPDGE